MKAAVYSGTRNLYADMSVAARTLVAHSSVDKIYFLIEDDTFPEPLPEMVETINVRNQKWFPPDGPNYRTSFTYMSLLRVCYTKVLPETLDRVLQLDVDTIVCDDIDALWDMDLDGKWFAAATERRGNFKPYGPSYFNVGVAMFNLDQIRKDHADDLMIEFLNTTQVPYIDQDAWNAHWRGHSVELDGRYNESIVTGWSEHPAIVHYAGYRQWQTNPDVMFRGEYLAEARRLKWEDVLG